MAPGAVSAGGCPHPSGPVAHRQPRDAPSPPRPATGRTRGGWKGVLPPRGVIPEGTPSPYVDLGRKQVGPTRAPPGSRGSRGGAHDGGDKKEPPTGRSEARIRSSSSPARTRTWTNGTKNHCAADYTTGDGDSSRIRRLFRLPLGPHYYAAPPAPDATAEAGAAPHAHGTAFPAPLPRVGFWGGGARKTGGDRS